MIMENQEKKERFRKPHNDVPAETILKYVLKEKGELQAENAELKFKVHQLETQLENKANAITAFKAWQAKVAEYNYTYWLNQGVELMQEKPNANLTIVLRRFLEKNDFAKKQIKKLLSQLQSLESLRNNLETILKEESKG